MLKTAIYKLIRQAVKDEINNTRVLINISEDRIAFHQTDLKNIIIANDPSKDSSERIPD